MAAEEMHNSLNDMRENIEALLQTILGQKLYHDTKQFALRHPFVFTGISSICVFSLVPLLFFLGFAVVTLFIALICFLCIEGSIIAFGGLVFIGVVSFISVIVIAIVSALAVAFWIFQHIAMVLASRQLFCFNSKVKAIAIVEEKTE